MDLSERTREHKIQLHKDRATTRKKRNTLGPRVVGYGTGPRVVWNTLQTTWSVWKTKCDPFSYY